LVIRLLTLTFGTYAPDVTSAWRKSKPEMLTGWKGEEVAMPAICIYSDEATGSMKRMQSNTMQKAGEIHPTIDIQVSNDRCLSCHSRSGRISLSYEGWNETNEGTKANSIVKSKVLPDKRLLEFVQRRCSSSGRYVLHRLSYFV